jgi:hypothetical protein
MNTIDMYTREKANKLYEAKAAPYSYLRSPEPIVWFLPDCICHKILVMRLIWAQLYLNVSPQPLTS